MTVRHRWTGTLAVLHQPTTDGRVLSPPGAEVFFVGPLAVSLPGGDQIMEPLVGTVLDVEVTGDELVGSGEMDLAELRKHDPATAERFERGEPIGVQAAVTEGDVYYHADKKLELCGPWRLSYVVLGPPVWEQATIRMVE